jgi:GNAT superfamily N-acetyltransferase
MAENSSIRPARLLLDAFRKRTEDWEDPESARQEVLASLTADRISRLLVDESGMALGWIGGIPMYGGRVWELHPLVVSGSHRRRGIGRALVEDLERLVRTAFLPSALMHDQNLANPLANIGLEPPRPTVCAIMSPWRAAQTARWADA